jgi:general secretion pathway protein A
MYNDFFGFRDYPFNVTADPKIFYTNPIYQRTYAYLLYAICERKGVIVLTGEAGTGKTTLLRRLIENLENIVQFAFCPYPISSFADLLDFVCDDLALPQKPQDQTQQLEALRSFLIARKRQKQYCALLIDEAHNLQPPVLSALVQLADFTVEGEMLLPIILVGQPELEDNLSHPLAASLKLLVTGSHRLDRLKKNEVGPFIFHRLSAADCDRHNIFPPEVVRDIAEYSQGIPRCINTICDNSLLVACAEAKNVVTREIIEEVARDLRLPAATDPEREVSTRSYRPEHSHTGTTPELSVQQSSVFDTLAHQQGQSLLAPGSGFFPRVRRQLITGVGLGVCSLLLFLLSSHLPSSVATKLDLEHGPPPEFNSAKTLLPSSLPSSSPQTPPIIASQKKPLPLDQTNKPPEADFSEQATREVTIATLYSSPAVTDTEQKKTHADSQRAPSPSVLTVQSEKVLPSLLPEETLAPKRHLQEKSEKRTSTANQQTPLTHALAWTSQGEKEQLEAPRRTTARRDEKGSTPLMLAVMHGHTETVEELLRKGADINEQNADGRTALMLAALAGRTSMLQTLLINGAVVNATNAEGWTALMYAAWNGHTKIVQLLVRSGADVEVKNSAGGTALAHALRNGHREAARVLRTGAAGAAVKKPNKLAEAKTSRSRDAHSLVLLKSSERR